MRSSAVLAAFLLSAMFFGCGSAPTSERTDDEQSELCSSGGLVSDDSDNVASPGTIVTWTGTASCAFPNPEFEFWQRDTTGTWSIVQGWSTSDKYVWDTTGAVEGEYAWQVWAREAGSVAPYETYRSQRFNITSASLCTSVSAAANPPGTAAIGTTVSITGSASCGASTPEYAVYQLKPGDTTYTLLNAYTTTATFDWDTTGESAGTHYIQVWARAVGSPKAYDTYTTLAYVLGSSAVCTSPTLGFNPSSPAAVGTIVGLTGAASGCGTPTFKYWIHPPGGAWQVLQDWTTSSFLNWNTTGQTTGYYGFQLWVRQSGSTANYESYANASYLLTSATNGVTQRIGAGAQHTCQIASAGTARCWGYNANGQLGNGSTTASIVSVPVTGISSATALATGYYHNCVIDGGAVKCWGANLRGQIGNGSTTDAPTPVAVSGLSNVTSIAAGAAHTCAALIDGSVRCWGYNSQGQLGDGTLVDRTTPVVVPGILNAVRVAAGYYHSCALLADGTAKCWGLNDHGQLGDGTTTNSLTPVTVTGLSGVQTISAASSHTCASLTGGTANCWGANNNGVLGDGTTTDSSSPVAVSGLTQATAVITGPYHSCAAIGDGSARCWGWNVYGELGDGTKTDSLTPVVVTGLSTVDSIAVGWHHSCSALQDGTAQCWGYNGVGQLGDGTQTQSSTPVLVQ
ncbi:MAG: hypothetical protein KC766_17270 [Myxococcales bacterium]|nr:hypothetical protein [Myxococcales bacterium]